MSRKPRGIARLYVGPNGDEPETGMAIRGLETSMGGAGYCRACERWMPDGPDICLGYLPFTSHACCGHGGDAEPYLVLTLAGPDADMTEVGHSITLRNRLARVVQRLLTTVVEHRGWG